MTRVGRRDPGTRRRGRRTRLAVVFAALGPGLIAANAGNDAGGIATYASAGAQFGYRMLFVLSLLAVAVVVVQEMAGRVAAYTGEGLLALIREHFSLRVGTFAVACLVLANAGVVVANFAGIGAAFELFGVSRYLAVPVAAAVIWSIVVLGSYRYAERLLLVLSLAFIAYPVAAILGDPSWSDLAVNTVTPHFLATREFLVLAVAIVGTTISPYMQLYQAGAVADRGIGPDEYPVERFEIITGNLFAIGIAMAIVIATASIGASGPLSSAEQAARALRPVAGPAAEVLFGLGLLGASALAATVVPLSTAYALAEAVGTERSVSHRFSQAPLFLGLFTAQIVLGAAVALAPGNLIDLLINTYILNGLITPVILIFLLILTSRRSVLGDAANSPRLRVAATVCVAAVATLAVAVVGQTVAGWL